MTRLGAMLGIYCRLQNISTRDLAKEMRTSPATAHRLMQGKDCDSATFVKLLLWLTEEQRP